MIPLKGIRIQIVRCALLIPALGALVWGVSRREGISAEAPPVPTATPQTGPVIACFSRPQAFDGAYAGGPDEALVRAIDAAELSVDIASYDFDLLSVARALLGAADRGAAVRIVVDSDNWHTEALDLLRAAGIPIVGDGRESLMHDKFVVIDGREVWAGSMNLTVNDAYRNDNNLLRIRSVELAEIFTAEFGEMFGARKFGTSSPAGKPAAPVDTEAGPVEALFAPEDQVARRVIQLIRDARRSIHFLAFSFTSKPIGEAMLARAAEGIEVAGVMEGSQVRSNTGTRFDPFRLAGVAVFMDANPRNMHHKVILLDGEIVVTGSYNYTDSAENKNDEAALIFRSPELAAGFEREFQRIFALAAGSESP